MAAGNLTELSDRLRRVLRRRVLRHRRRLLAVCLTVAVFAGLRAVVPPEPATVPLLVAARDLPAGEMLGEDDLEVVEAPPSLAPAGRQELAEALGRTTTGPVRRGEPVTDARLVTASLLEGYPGLVALPVRLPDPGAVALLRVGDRVDLLATDPTSGLAETVAIDVPLISIPDAPPTGSGVTGAQLGGRLVVVAVTSSTARTIAAAAATRYLAAVISR